MKKFIQLLSVLLLVIVTSFAQPQMKNWFIAPKKIYMPQVGNPAVSTISGTPVTASGVANGFYDNAGTGNLLFYIADGSVYDYNNTLVGALNPPGMASSAGAEVIIVPFGTNDACQSKFNIFSTGGGFITNISLYQTVLDMNSFSLTSIQIDAMPIVQEFGAIAAGNVIAGSGGDRYLYFMGGSGTLGGTDGQIRKLLIQNNGTVIVQGLLYPATPYQNAGAEIFSRELDLSPDGKYLAWGSNAPASQMSRYHFLELNSLTGNYVNGTYQQFNITGATGNNTGGLRGVEFYQPQTGALRLFMGAGSSGIYYTTIPNASTFTLVSSSASPKDFGYSQLELSHNGNMYASSDPVVNLTFNVGAFNPALTNPSMVIGAFPSFTLSSPNPPNSGWGGAPLYTLPDQIDGQDYNLITPPAVATVPTLNSYTQNTTTTWTYTSGANPWGAASFTPVHVINEIVVDGNSTLTINAMTIKFSPQAKFIIKKGSKVILDNGTILTSNHIDECNLGYTWKGVQVRGDINTNQNATNGQGKLTVKNGSTIEYAECAAKNWDGINANTTGGIIIANTGSVFKNNKVDVELKPFPNFPSYAYKASFNNCSFFSNNLYPFATAPQHVTIEGCKGVTFSLCSFQLNSTLPFRHSYGLTE